MDQYRVLVLLGISALLIVACFVVALWFCRIWLRAMLSGEPIMLLRLVGMQLRGNPPGLLVDTYLALKHRGDPATLDEVEHVYIAHKGEPLSPRDLADVVVNMRPPSTSRR